jgi:hypothetical protein
MTDPIIPRKWRLQAHNQTNVFIWGRQERSTHTLMKAFLWAFYLPQDSQMSIEIRISDRYKPDVVAMPATPNIYAVNDDPLVWANPGKTAKIKFMRSFGIIPLPISQSPNGRRPCVHIFRWFKKRYRMSNVPRPSTCSVFRLIALNASSATTA